MMKDWMKIMTQYIGKWIPFIVCIHVVICMFFFDGIMFHKPFGWQCKKIYNHNVYIPVNWEMKEDNQCVYFEDKKGQLMMFGIQMDPKKDKCKTPSFVDFYKFKYAEIIYLFVLINYF